MLKQLQSQIFNSSHLCPKTVIDTTVSHHFQISWYQRQKACTYRST